MILCLVFKCNEIFWLEIRQIYLVRSGFFCRDLWNFDKLFNSFQLKILYIYIYMYICATRGRGKLCALLIVLHDCWKKWFSRYSLQNKNIATKPEVQLHAVLSPGIFSKWLQISWYQECGSCHQVWYMLTSIHWLPLQVPHVMHTACACDSPHQSIAGHAASGFGG